MNDKTTSDTRHTYTDKEISFEAIRKCYKTYDGMTFNDFMLAIFGKCFYQLCKQEGIGDPKFIRSMMPAGHKKMPKGYNNLVIKNYTVLSDFQLYLADSVKTVYDKIKPHLTHILNPEIQKQLMNFYHITPYVPKSFLSYLILEEIKKETHFLVSNIYFSDRPYVICGKEVRKFRFFNNNGLAEGISGFIFTYNNKVTFTSCVMERSDFDGERYTDLVMANVQEEIDLLQKQA